MKNEQLYLIWVEEIGENIANEFIYKLYFSETTSKFAFNEINDTSCGFDEIILNEAYIKKIKLIKTKIKLDLLKDSYCFNVYHGLFGIVALAWENIDEYEDYPEDGRLLFNYADTYEEVEKKLAEKNILFEE